MKPIQLAVFDIAGTTVEDDGNVAESFISAFRQFNIAITKESAVRVMGYRKKEAIRILLDEFNITIQGDEHELVERVHDRFIQQMIHFYQTTTRLKPLPGAESLFAWLQSKNIKVALNTGFVKAITNEILARLGWDDNADINAVISSDEVQNGRPYPDMIMALMQQTGVADPEQVLKIGDTLVDIQEGRNARCGLVIGVTTGANTREELAAQTPDRVIGSLDELPFILMQTNIAV